MRAYLYIAVVLSLLVGGFLSGKEWAEGQQAQDEQLIKKAGAAAQIAAAEAIAKIEIKNVTRIQKLETEIVEKPVYRECKHDPVALGVLNDILTNADTADRGELPGADAPGR